MVRHNTNNNDGDDDDEEEDNGLAQFHTSGILRALIIHKEICNTIL